MTIRLSAELDRELTELAAHQRVSKQTLILRGAELIIARHARREEVDRGIDFILAHDAELIGRLEDA